MSRLFDAAVALCGAVLVVVVAIHLSAHPALTGAWGGQLPIACAVALPLVLLVQRAEVTLALSAASPNAPVISFDSLVFVFVGCLFHPGVALLAWSLGQLVSTSIDRMTPQVRCFNLGLMVLSAGAGLLTLDRLGLRPATDLSTGRSVLIIAAGWLVYLLAFYGVLLASLSFESADGLRGIISASRTGEALAMHVAVDSLAALAAILLTTFAWWSVAFALVPEIALIWSATALSRAAEHQHRLTALFDAAKEMQLIDDYDGIVRTLRARAPDVVGTGGAELRAALPQGSELGAQVRNERAPLWIVAGGLNRRDVRRSADQQALEALATIGEEALLRASLAEEMNRLAHHDAMTGLANRALFVRQTTAVLADQMGSGRVALMYLDLDGFKAINDRLGHSAGDELLVEVARRMSACVRGHDLVARLGGDEFAILIRWTDEKPDLEALAQRLIRAVGQPLVLGPERVVVGISVGIAVALHSDTADDLLRYSDTAMYEAKRRGHNGFHVFGNPLPDQTGDGEAERRTTSSTNRSLVNTPGESTNG